MDRLAYGTVRTYHSTDGALDHAPVYELPSVKGSRFRAAICGIDVSACQTEYEDRDNSREITWALFHNEVQVAISGCYKAEYWLPSLTTKHGKAVAEPESEYYSPRGCRVLWRVLSHEPFRHLCITDPIPSQQAGAARSVAARQP